MDETETPKPWIRQYLYTQIYYNRKNIVQLVAKKKTGNENFPHVNLVLSICQLIVYLTVPVK
jgi:hypothetical protein